MMLMPMYFLTALPLQMRAIFAEAFEANADVLFCKAYEVVLQKWGKIFSRNMKLMLIYFSTLLPAE